MFFEGIISPIFCIGTEIQEKIVRKLFLLKQLKCLSVDECKEQNRWGDSTDLGELGLLWGTDSSVPHIYNVLIILAF